ncbi:hypothetical protein [Paraburkholderia unamae]|uniref:Integrase n=1 Tax=Paraburkholderia unamae TaxID=219649 RepID=A0ABX5KKS1_9BURK|nr:hypothetical protein [Paraburkholderia unamae]PVX82462.1 hypothetical protein C7402_109316 [Paraburkholderia unamae]
MRGKKKRSRTPRESLQFISELSNDPNLNLERVVAKAKQLNPFSHDWEVDVWALGHHFNPSGTFIPDAVPITSFDPGSRRITSVTLIFDDLYRGGKDKTKVVDTIDFSKAFVALRQFLSARGKSMVTRDNDVLRALFGQLKDIDYRIEMISRRHFERTQRYLSEKYKHATCYVRCSVLTCIARFIDNNGLSRFRLDWKSRLSSTEPSKIQELIDPTVPSEKQERFAEETAVRAIGYMYQTIPRENHRDRLLICLISLAVIFGLRAREVVTLPIASLYRDGDGILQLRYFRRKRGTGGGDFAQSSEEEVDLNGKIVTYVGLDEKVVPTIWCDIVVAIFEELSLLTAEARRVALEIEASDFVPFMENKLPKELLTFVDIEEFFGLAVHSGRDFCEARGIKHCGKKGRAFVFSSVDVLDALARDVFVGPIMYGRNGKPIMLSEVVGIVFPNQMRRKSATNFTYAVFPLNTNVLREFLGNRREIASGFEAYDVGGKDGDFPTTRPHALRSFINDLLDKGGLSELAQAEWFGRKLSQNEAYHSKTSYQRADELRPQLTSGRFAGKLVDALASVPQNEVDAYAAARVQTIHVIPGGFCVREFSQESCDLHFDCNNACGDLLLDAESEQRPFFVSATKALEINVKAMKAAMKRGAEVSLDAFEHQIRKLKTYREAIRLIDERSKREQS